MTKPLKQNLEHSLKEQKLDPRNYLSIWILAWPVLINIGSHTLFSIIDLYWVHTLGTEAIAAVALDGNIIFCMFGLTQIIYIGALAMVSRRIGAKEISGRNGAGSISTQSIQLSILLGLAIAGGGALLSAEIISLFDVNAQLNNYATDYLQPMMWSFLPLFPMMAIGAVFTACGDTRTPMYIAVFGNILNAALDPFLIFGWAGLPEMGVAGAGVASLICQIVALALTLVAFKYRKLPFEKVSLWSNQGISAWASLLRIGIPSGAAAITRPLSTLFLLKVISSFGSEGVAAFGITVRAASVIWLYHGALSAAVSTLTGQSLGNKDFLGIQVLIKNSITVSIITSLILGSGYFIFAEEILGIFEKDNALVISLGVLFLQLLVSVSLVSAPALIWASVMMGAGETRSPMLIAIQANWLIKLPLAWLLGMAMGMGIEGIWYAMVLSIIYEDIAIFIAYRKGKWKQLSF
jgi:putative MATE family efflux protein